MHVSTLTREEILWPAALNAFNHPEQKHHEIYFTLAARNKFNIMQRQSKRLGEPMNARAGQTPEGALYPVFISLEEAREYKLIIASLPLPTM